MKPTEDKESNSTDGLRLRPLRLVGFVLGFAVVAAGAEVGLRIETPEAASNATKTRTFGSQHPRHPDRGFFELDDELGFRPVLDNGKYGPHGALANEYELAKDPARERVLLLGDSVLVRGVLLEAIRSSFGEEQFEWWNAGVEAYATTQEVMYYRDYLGPIEADHVVVVFNMTDFETTPLISLDANGKLQIFNARRTGTNAWLMQHSYLYKYYVGRTLGTPEIGLHDDSVFELVEESLAELQRLTRQRGASLTVLVIPWMRPVKIWTPLVKGNHVRTLAMLKRLGIRHFAALPALEETAAAGEPLGDPDGDLMHPGIPLCTRFAATLQREGFLRPNIRSTEETQGQTE